MSSVDKIDILAAKHDQAQDLLANSEMDAWITFAREAGDPIGPLVVGTEYVGEAAFIFTEEEKVALCADYDTLPIERLGLFDEVVSYSVGIEREMQETLKRLNPARIGLNFSTSDERADGLTHGMYLKLCQIADEALSDYTFVSAAKLEGKLRSLKVEGEVERIKAAIQVSEEIFAGLREFIEPGRTELDVARYIKSEAEDRGASLSGEWPIVATGEAGLAHRDPSKAPVKAKDVVVIDLGLRKEGYCSDFARTYFVPPPDGGVPPSLKRRVKAVAETISYAASLIEPRLAGYEMKEKADEFLSERGISPPRFALGHQVGTAVHDGGLVLGPRTPRYEGRVEGEIEAGNVFTLEPFLVPEEGEEEHPVGIEEIVLVRSDGAELLTEPQTEPLVVGK